MDNQGEGLKTGKRRNNQRKNITVRKVDNPKEYARQYYWVVVKGKTHAPPRQRKRKKK